MSEADAAFDPESFSRPDSSLLTYYFFASLLWGPLFPIIFTIRWIRYVTLRYQIGATRMTASWGKLAHREVSLGYERVQDIHLRRNFIERQLGLARIEIQTASGDAKAEIALEGALEYEEMRAFLLRRVRAIQASHSGNRSVEAAVPTDERALVAVLHEVADELRAVRALLAERESDIDDGEAEAVS